MRQTGSQSLLLLRIHVGSLCVSEGLSRWINAIQFVFRLKLSQTNYSFRIRS